MTKQQDALIIKETLKVESQMKLNDLTDIFYTALVGNKRADHVFINSIDSVSDKLTTVIPLTRNVLRDIKDRITMEILQIHIGDAIILMDVRDAVAKVDRTLRIKPIFNINNFKPNALLAHCLLYEMR